ncbi:histidinol-phosphate transaminase [Vibrio diazotrophicus]|uniref:Histidinol-phosphate aminotransferase n=1 Tax=Vibrio diazotrophicus TaxID=685 RepID=A0ABX4WFW2_VIBDI|nr:histidinol-phosphate transaminase [Vibrio diazotrophicus]PNI03536.1 histidinol-phosphate transaminase [Vibrio diazotrophicus]
MSSLAASLVPEVIKKLIPYQSARRIGGSGRVWLNANELEFPIHFDNQEQSYNRYPDFLPHDVASAYQKYAGVDAPVLAVRGADEAIDLLIRTFCQPGKDKIVVCPPTYAMYEFCADALAMETIKVPLVGDAFELDCQGVIQAAKEANLVFLCSPNNPTGNLIPQAEIVKVLEGTQDDAIVVVDEAYIEFEMEHNAASLIAQYPNLVVIRTLSKAFGLAAVRCGFIIADKSVMDFVSKLIPPYPMPDSSATVVLAALSETGLKQVEENTQTLIRTREWFISELDNLPCIAHVYPSSTNFVLVRTHSGEDLFAYLLKQGIVTRNQSHDPALRNCVRITIGSQSSMEEVISVLRSYPTQS